MKAVWAACEASYGPPFPVVITCSQVIRATTYAHFNSADACALTWQDIEFDNKADEYVHITHRRDSIAGATHDFTRPCFPFCASILRKRREHLLKTYSVDKLMDMPVVSTCRNPAKPIKGKDLTSFCKSILRNSGVPDTQLLQLKASSQAGVGVRLLHKNYKHKLAHFCGLSTDTAAIAFLSGRSLHGDTTADHYRSFTSPEGQWYLYAALCRDTRFFTSPEQYKEAERGDGQIILHPSAPNFHAGAIVTLKMKKGETIQISATKGVSGNFSVEPI